LVRSNSFAARNGRVLQQPFEFPPATGGDSDYFNKALDRSRRPTPPGFFSLLPAGGLGILEPLLKSSEGARQGLPFAVI